MVAAATNNLCEAANAAVQGHASQEKLISSAKQVAASTAQLLVACKVKADQDSEAMKRLQVRNPDPSHCTLGCAALYCHPQGMLFCGRTLSAGTLPQFSQPHAAFSLPRLLATQ